MFVYDGRISLFFFFKQKTADDMRISDWSSDVCSSDLHKSAWTNLYLAINSTRAISTKSSIVTTLDAFRFGLKLSGLRGKVASGLNGKIGRASCRERVCQYV